MPPEGGRTCEEEYPKSDYDSDAPFNYEFLKSEIEKKGPLEIWKVQNQVKFMLNITPCQIPSCDCNNDVITLTQIAGFTSLTTPIDKDKMLENESLNAFLHDYFHNQFVYSSSSGEQQFIEREIERHFGFTPLDVFHGKVAMDEVVVSLSEEIKADPWSLHNLQSIYRALLLRRLEITHFGDEDFQEEFERRFETPEAFMEFLKRIYDLGFLTSRIIGEHFVREEIQPYAQKGAAAEEAQERRSEAGGKTANKKRHKRIAAMLVQMEVLVESNPALRRLKISQIADLAIEDAVAVDPSLWSQGKGQRDEYLDELKSDIRYTSRFRKLRQKTA